MSDFNKKKYTIDGNPVTPRELIDEASEVDPVYDRDWYKSTRTAAAVLRRNGYEVDYYRGHEDE